MQCTVDEMQRIVQLIVNRSIMGMKCNAQWMKCSASWIAQPAQAAPCCNSAALGLKRCQLEGCAPAVHPLRSALLRVFFVLSCPLEALRVFGQLGCAASVWLVCPLPADLQRATGMAESVDSDARRLNRVVQLTGLSDPVYAEACITVGCCGCCGEP